MSDKLWVGLIALTLACILGQIILTAGNYPNIAYTGGALLLWILGLLGFAIMQNQRPVHKATTTIPGSNMMGVNLNISFSWRWLFVILAVVLVGYQFIDGDYRPNLVRFKKTIVQEETARTPDVFGVTSAEHGKILWNIEVDDLKVKLVRTDRPSCSSGFMDRIELYGDIGPDSTFVVEKMLRKVESCGKRPARETGIPVYLNSGGGLLDHGYKLGRMFREWGVYTRIREGDGCASSCAVAFLGGKKRLLSDGGGIMFHAPYVVTGEARVNPVTGEVEPVISCNIGEDSFKELFNYYVEMVGEEAGKRLLERTYMDCSQSDGWVVLQEEAAILYQINTP